MARPNSALAHAHHSTALQNSSPILHTHLLLDCWPVHISKAFRAWCAEDWHDLLLLYVAPDTTSRLRPQDKFYNRPFKVATKKAFCDHQIEMFRRAGSSGMFS